jgi:hypothetical protein
LIVKQATQFWRRANNKQGEHDAAKLDTEHVHQSAVQSWNDVLIVMCCEQAGLTIKYKNCDSRT